MLKPLKVGPYTIKSNVLLAPMAGVTDMPFRSIVSSFNLNILTFSEMISSEALVRSNRRTLKMLESNQRLKAVQIAGNDPDKMAQSAKINEELGADIIDINMGCPAKKIVNNYTGSWLMKDENLARNIIKSVVESVTIPVTLKMRLGWNEENKNAINIAQIAQNLGVKMITIHGRTRCQMYSGKADWEAISAIKDSIKGIPVICNGDISSPNLAHEALLKSHCDGIMIGRAAIGRPWLLNQIDSSLKDLKNVPDPNPSSIKEVALRHLELSVNFYGKEQGITNFRKHILAYTKGFPCSSSFRRDILGILNKDILISEICAFFDKFTD